MYAQNKLHVLRKESAFLGEDVISGLENHNFAIIQLITSDLALTFFKLFSGMYIKLEH